MSLLERTQLPSLQPLEFVLTWAGATRCGRSTSARSCCEIELRVIFPVLQHEIEL